MFVPQVVEIIQTGGLRRIKYENTDEIKAVKLFEGIYGVGQSSHNSALRYPHSIFSRRQYWYYVGRTRMQNSRGPSSWERRSQTLQCTEDRYPILRWYVSI